MLSINSENYSLQIKINYFLLLKYKKHPIVYSYIGTKTENKIKKKRFMSETIY